MAPDHPTVNKTCRRCVNAKRQMTRESGIARKHSRQLDKSAPPTLIKQTERLCARLFRARPLFATPLFLPSPASPRSLVGDSSRAGMACQGLRDSAHRVRQTRPGLSFFHAGLVFTGCRVCGRPRAGSSVPTGVSEESGPADRPFSSLTDGTQGGPGVAHQKRGWSSRTR